MRRPAGSYAMGIEVLLGLALGAAAAASLVALVLTLLLGDDLEGQRRARIALLTAEMAEQIAGGPSEPALESAAEPLLLSGDISDAVLAGQARRDSLVASGWVAAPVPGGMTSVVVEPPARRPIHLILFIGLAILALFLVLLSAMTPAFVSRSVTGPLRGILADADRHLGSPTSPAAARASFGQLVRNLSERDAELARLKGVAERRADVAEERSAAVIAGISSALLALDGDGILRLFNPSAAALFGLVSDDVGGAFPRDRNAASAGLWEILGRRGTGNEEEYELEVEEGARAYGISFASAAGWEIVLATDMTQFRMLQQRLAEEAAMAGLGTVSAGIAHEMGNTLGALSGFLDLLARGHSDVRTANILEEAGLEIDSARRMISSFKLLASGEPDLKVVTTASAAGTAAMACRDLGPFSLDGAEMLRGRVTADMVLVGRCLMNLLRNAREADPPGTPGISFSEADGWFVISVSDRGPGLGQGPEILERPFYSTKAESGHMGMGLTLSRRIASLHGGALRAYERPGGGAVFELRLPLLPEGG